MNEPVQQEELLLDENLKVSVKRSLRRTRWSLEVRPGGAILFLAPYFMSEAKIRALLSKHQDWIKKRHKKYHSLSRIKLSHEWSEGAEVYFRGAILRLKLLRSHYPHVSAGSEELLLASADFRPTVLKKIFEGWVEEIAFRDASLLLAKWCPRFELASPPPLKFRTLKRSWGQCRSDGRITLHSQLARLHPEFFEYVFVHEMCHLFHMNHSRAFKDLLESHLPHWKEIKKKYEPLLF